MDEGTWLFRFVLLNKYSTITCRMYTVCLKSRTLNVNIRQLDLMWTPLYYSFFNFPNAKTTVELLNVKYPAYCYPLWDNMFLGKHTLHVIFSTFTCTWWSFAASMPFCLDGKTILDCIFVSSWLIIHKVKEVSNLMK